MRALSILVVERDNRVRGALREALQHHGHVVHEAASGEEAWDILRNSLVDVVLLDLRLPTMSGQTLFHMMISRWPKLRSRVAVMAGDPAKSRQDPWIRLYRLPVLQKPPGPAEVLAVLADVAADEPGEANGGS